MSVSRVGLLGMAIVLLYGFATAGFGRVSPTIPKKQRQFKKTAADSLLKS
tara:strand:+ start:977 stop:1126 length:150 start_codon:yes stop_codon:yes gene_type:complete